MQHIGIVDIPTDLGGERAEQGQVVVKGCAQSGIRFPEAEADDTQGE